MATRIENTIVPALNEADAAEVLGLSRATLRCWRSRRIGPPYRKHGRRVVYDPAEIRAWSAEHGQAPAGPRRALVPVQPPAQPRTVLA